MCPEESHQDSNGTGNHFSQGIWEYLEIFRLEKPQKKHNTPTYLIDNHVEVRRDFCSVVSKKAIDTRDLNLGDSLEVPVNGTMG